MTKIKSKRKKTLTDEQEKKLISWIKEGVQQHKSRNRKMIIQKAKILAKKENNWDGSSWYRHFMKIHDNELRKSKAKSIKPCRIRYSLVEHFNLYYMWL